MLFNALYFAQFALSKHVVWVNIFVKVEGRTLKEFCFKIFSCWDFPGGAVVGNLPANAGDTGSIPGPGRSHMPRGN